MAELPPRPKIVILGTGFGAFSVIRNLKMKSFDVTVVSPRNHFLFTPLLPSTTVGTVEFRSIIEPIREVKKGIKYCHANCVSLSAEKKIITCEAVLDRRSFDLKYDYLIIAVGAESSTYGIPGVQEYAFFLKDLSDARKIRQRIISCLDRAGTPGLTDQEMKNLLNFVVVGGGPTGVEFAAEMHDFLEEDLADLYPDLAPFVNIVLLEAGKQILTSFDATLSDYAMKIFQRQRIDVRTHSAVQRVEEGHVILADGVKIPYGLLVWATGNGPISLIKSLPFEKDRTQRLITTDYSLVKGQGHIFSLGDCAVMENNPLPATAQVAQQAGKHVAKHLNRLVQGKPPKPFNYHHMGMLAYIGSHRALADLPKIKGRGFSTWLFWRSAYLTKLVSFQNKFLVLFDWFKKVLFGRDISRF